MSMFTQESKTAIGLDNVAKRWPWLTGLGVRVLQVEWDVKNRPDHVQAVRDVVLEIAPECGLTTWAEKDYIKNLCGYVSLGLFGYYTYNPKPATWDIENHSYTGTDGDAVKTPKAMDDRIARDGVLVYASGPNSFADVKPLWLRSRKAVLVGTPSSYSGIQGMGESNPPDRPYPDIKVPTSWTSIATPALAASAALVKQAAVTRGIGQFPAVPPIVNGVPRIDYWIADTIGEPREVAPQPETWTQRNEVVSVVYNPFYPAQVEQTRIVTTTTRTWQESNLGAIKDDTTKTESETEKRVLNLPTT